MHRLRRAPHRGSPARAGIDREQESAAVVFRRFPRRKRPAKYRDPQNPGQAWSGIGRVPKWVQAILAERGIDRAAFKSIPMYQIHSSS